MPVIYSNAEKTVENLLDMRQKNQLRVPLHQRGYCWDDTRKHELIQSVLAGLPIPCICLYEDGRRVLWIEDGQQRITTLQLFQEGKFEVPGLGKFEGLTPLQQHIFLNYKIPVLEFKNATQEERITIFDRFQNGIPLSIGERYNSLRLLSPTVGYACELLLTPGRGVHNRCIPIWGPRELEDADDEEDERRDLDGTKRFTVLKQAVATTAGLLWGPEWITDRYEQIRKKLYEEVTEEQKRRAEKLLDRILRVYERVALESAPEKRVMKDRQIQNAQWKVGNFTGYLLYSFWMTDEAKWDAIAISWVKFLVAYRETPSLLKERLHSKTASKKNGLTVEKWNPGCKEVLGESVFA